MPTCFVESSRKLYLHPASFLSYVYGTRYAANHDSILDSNTEITDDQ